MLEIFQIPEHEMSHDLLEVGAGCTGFSKLWKSDVRQCKKLFNVRCPSLLRSRHIRKFAVAWHHTSGIKECDFQGNPFPWATSPYEMHKLLSVPPVDMLVSNSDMDPANTQPPIHLFYPGAVVQQHSYQFHVVVLAGVDERRRVLRCAVHITSVLQQHGRDAHISTRTSHTQRWAWRREKRKCDESMTSPVLV